MSCIYLLASNDSLHSHDLQATPSISVQEEHLLEATKQPAPWRLSDFFLWCRQGQSLSKIQAAMESAQGGAGKDAWLFLSMITSRWGVAYYGVGSLNFFRPITVVSYRKYKVQSGKRGRIYCATPNRVVPGFGRNLMNLETCQRGGLSTMPGG